MVNPVVEEARRWIGTPYCHQASLRGAGCDCLGLIRGVWREVHGAEPEAPPPYSADWDEVAGRDVLAEAATRLLVPVRTTAPGTILLFRMRRGAVAKHLGICSEVGSHPRFVHAYSGHGVKETTLSAPWRARLVAQFELPPKP